MPKGFSEREKEIIHQRLLEEGRKTFSAYGLKKTNIEDLTRAAGISKGAFYLFYESKEDLFMDVAEEAERQFRQVVLQAVEAPGPTPRARLTSVLKTAFTIWKTTPILQMVQQEDYRQLLMRLPPEKVQEHLASDRQFITVLMERCRQCGIPFQADMLHTAMLMNALFFVSLHEEDFGPDVYPATIDLMIDLTAAYCLGEVPPAV